MLTKDTDKKLFLLDAYALIYRAYYAFIRTPRINSKGMNTSAIFGFTNTLLEVIRNEKPTHIAVVFDAPEETVRHIEFPAYKANRDETPEDIRLAVPWILKIIEGFNIPIIMQGGYEADDIIGTLAKKAEEKGYTTYMMTPDKDFGQLVSENIFMYKPGRSGKPAEIWGVPEICERFSVTKAEQVIDILGLWGDSVDNIPGIPGIGEKTAKKLIKQYESVEGLIANVGKLKGKQKENVESFAEQGLLSKKLATIILDVPVPFEDEALVVEEPNLELLQELFGDLEFRTLARKLTNGELPTQNGNGESAIEILSNTEGEQMDLFSQPATQPIAEPSGFKTLEDSNHNYSLVQTKDQINKLVQTLQSAPVYCFDTETSDLDPLTSFIVGMSFSIKPHEAWYVPISQDRKEAIETLGAFKPVFEDQSKTVIAQNFKFDYKVLLNNGLKIENKVFDTMVAHYLMNPDMKHNMDVLAETYLNYTPVSIETLIGKKGKSQGSMADLTPEQVKDYASEDADITYQLYDHFKSEMEQPHLKSLFEDVEVPLIRVLGEMEMEGVNLDNEALSAFSKELGSEISVLEKDIFDLAGTQFNIDSPKQLGPILFEHLKISEKAKKTKTGQYSTGEDVLSKHIHDHEIVPKILEYRQIRKLKSTYVDSLPDMINSKTGRVHTNYMQTVAATGRLSSNNPNLQNIPIRTERGREIRKAFIPRSEEYELFAADYSQVELRIIASLSKDENMIDAFNAGADIHAATAAKVFGVDPKDVDREMRSKAKAVNFGIIYGQGAFGLSQNLNIPRKEGKEIIDAYFAQFPNLKSYQQENIEFARANGYVETIMGRRRYLKDINSNNAVVRGFAERNAINAPIQGSAADIIKVAMINIHKEMAAGEWKSKMIMQVHDELVFDAHKSEIEALTPMVINHMMHAVKLSVPLKVDTGKGNNWLEAH